MIDRRQAAAGVAFAALAGPAARAQIPADMAAVLAQRIARRGVGLVSAQVGRDGVVFAAAGRRAGADEGPPDEHTLFEIGSISKTFTALLLAEAVLRGEATLETPVETLLPGGITLRDSDDAPIRLLDLATHRSGLPRSPKTPSWIDRADPFGRFQASDMLQFLAAWKADVPRGARYEYSNLGVGLLGWLLARRAAKPFMVLLGERVLAPLQLDDVYIDVPPAARPRLATPHAADGTAAPTIDFGVLAPAGSLVASAAALARFAQAALGLLDDMPLAKAFSLSMRPYADGPEPNTQIGLVWFVSPLGDRLVYRHEGTTPGFSTALVLHPARRRGALVLGNARVPVGDLALHALDSRIRLPP